MELEAKINEYIVGEHPTNQSQSDFSDSLPNIQAPVQLPCGEPGEATSPVELPRSASRSPMEMSLQKMCIKKVSLQLWLGRTNYCKGSVKKQEKIRQRIAQSMPSAKIRRCSPLPNVSEVARPSDDDLLQAFSRKNEDRHSFFVSDGFSNPPGTDSDLS